MRVDVIASGTHSDPFVYTMETSTGTYRTHSVTHRNCRSAAYWHMRELLDPTYGSEILLPDSDLMISDLNTPTWSITTGVPPKIKVLEKDDVVEILGRSPDDGDAVVMAFWAEQLRQDAQVAVPQGRLPVRTLSPLAGRARPGVRAMGRGAASGMGPLG